MRKLVAALVLSTLPFAASAFTNEAFVVGNVPQTGNASFLLLGNTFSDFTLSVGVFGNNGELNWTAVDWNGPNGTASSAGFVKDQAVIFKLVGDGTEYYAGVEGYDNVNTSFSFMGTFVDFWTGNDKTSTLLFSFSTVFAGKGTTPQNLPAIPEPETYAMLLAGLGVVGAVARRRRTVV